MPKGSREGRRLQRVDYFRDGIRLAHLPILRMVRSICQRLLRNAECEVSRMSREFKDRLALARREAGHERPTDAARAFGWTTSTYLGYENGDRKPSREMAATIADAYRVSLDWLLRARGPMRKGGATGPPTVQVLGLVGAGSAMILYSEGDPPDDWVPAPANATEKTVALEIRGDSLGRLMNGWLLFYDDVRTPVTDDLIGKMCVVGLADGRVLVKEMQRGHLKGRFTLHSNIGEPPIYDAEVNWAARVKDMRPRGD